MWVIIKDREVMNCGVQCTVKRRQRMYIGLFISVLKETLECSLVFLGFFGENISGGVDGVGVLEIPDKSERVLSLPLTFVLKYI